MKEFMLIYQGGNPNWMEGMSPKDIEAVMGRWGEWMGKLQAQEKLVSGGNALQYSGKRVTPKGVVTDIASSELKELVSGYSVVRAETIDEAIELAKECPIMFNEDIVVEVREVQQM